MTETSATASPVLSILIVTYNCRELVLNCLDSLAAGAAGMPTEVIVVDNASNDGTVATLAARADVQLISSDRNRGFAWATNRALDRARGEYLLLLNPDTVVPRDALRRAVDELAARPEVGMLGCKLVQPDGSLDQACKRGFPTPLNSICYFIGLSRVFPRSRVAAGYVAGQIGDDEVAEVDAVNGAFMLTRRTAVQTVGPLDERYWMYMEDLDWCYRFREAGWPVLYWPEVAVVHVKGGSSGHPRPWRTNYAFHRGMWLFYRSHYAAKRSRAMNTAVWLGVWSKLGLSGIASAIRRWKSGRHPRAWAM